MIIHVDMDAFYASVEIRDNPKLVGKPVVVGGSPSGRGVVMAASYEARKFGIHSAMPSREALRRCSSLVFIKGRMSHYAGVSREIRKIFFEFTSLVEPLSLDEAFLDVSGCQRLFGPSPDIARQIKTKILADTGLVASAGVAPSKFLAKIASDLDKPNGLTIVDQNEIQNFLDPLPISRVWGIGPKTQSKFARLGVQTISQLRQLDISVLHSQIGDNAQHFYDLARGIDNRPVVPDRNAKSVSHEHTFPVDIYDDEILKAWLHELADLVGRRMRRHDIFSKTVQLKLRYDDFETITRRKTIEATHSTNTLFETAKELLRGSARHSRGVRLIGLGGANLSRSTPTQMSLFDQEEKNKQSRVDEISDSIRDRFGQSSLNRGSNLEHEIRVRPAAKVDDDGH